MRTSWNSLAGVTCAVALYGSRAVFAQPVLPDFSAATFDSSSATLTHPYFPFTSGKIYRYESEDIDPDTGEVEHEVIIVEALDMTRNVAGIESRIVRDRVFVEGLLIEDTFDWYAQDTDGNVWYVGEDVTDFEYDDDGNLIGTSHPGAWETGVDGALPGHIMPASLTVGNHFFQEFLVGEAEDHALIVGVDETFIIPGLGTFDNVLRTRDFSLDPTSFEEKLYAPGIGTIAEFGFAADGTPLGTTLLVSIVPEPTTAMLTLGGALMLFRGRRTSLDTLHPFNGNKHV